MKKIIIVIIITILAVSLGFIVWNNIYKQTEIKIVKLNEEIILEKGETAKIDGEETYLTIKKFTNSPTPEGTQSIWSGQGVTYELKIGDVTYISDIQGIFNEKIIYKVKTLESDYETYVKLKIEDNREDSKDLEDEEIDDIQEVDAYIQKILDDENFKKLAKNERISYMKDELNKLATDGTENARKPLIKKTSIYVDEESNQYNTMISFEYASGVLGGVMIPNELELTYKINNEMQSYNSQYSERGIYYDTLNTPGSPSFYFIAMGMKNTGGYTIKIEEINIDEEKNVEIIVREQEPEAGSTVTMAITYPVCGIEFNSSPNSIIVKNEKDEIFKSINY